MRTQTTASTSTIPTPATASPPLTYAPPTTSQPIATAQDISDYLPLVQRIASQFMRRLPRSVQRADLVAAGTVGLFLALRSTAHTSPAMFVAYASIRIRGAMVDELRRHDWSPRRRKVPGATDGATPSNDTSILPLASPSHMPPSVAVVGFDDLPVGTMAALAEEGLSPLEDALARSEREELCAAVKELPAREREIVRMRYFEGMPSKAIARALGLSEARVSQLHARATRMLREILAGWAEEMKLAG